jgi:hypothetical protein
MGREKGREGEREGQGGRGRRKKERKTAGCRWKKKRRRRRSEREREREREKAGCRSLTPVILVTWEAEIRRIMFQSQNSTDLVYRLGIEGTFVTYQLCDPSFF